MGRTSVGDAAAPPPGGYWGPPPTVPDRRRSSRPTTARSLHPMSQSPTPPQSVPALTLNDGHTIPQLGFGVFQVSPADTVAATTQALEIGYRHIDTAQMYGNEREVGEAVARTGIDRSEVFVTSKLNNGFHRPDDARRAFDRSLAALGFEYLDLFLGPLAAPHPLRRGLRLHLADPGRVPARRPGPVHRGVQLPAPPSRPPGRRDRRGALGQPGRDPPLPDPGRPPSLRP